MRTPSPAPAETIESRDAATRELLGRVPAMKTPEVVAVVERARRGLAGWRRTTPSARRRVFTAWLDEILAGQDELARLAVHESGKTMIDALLGDILPSSAALRDALRRGLPPRAVGARATTPLASAAARPPGIVGIVAPARFPLYGIVDPVVAALRRGHVVVVKLSEHASWSGVMYVEIIRDVLREHRIDPDAVQWVTGDRRSLAMLVEAGVDAVTGSGSDEGAAEVARLTAASGAPVEWRHHGNEPMIVCEDADLRGAVDAAMLGAFTPLAPPFVPAERILVHRRLHDAFVDAVRHRIGALRQGPPLDPEVDCGPLSPITTVEHIEALIHDALEHGARVRVGGPREQAYADGYYPPTLLVDVAAHMRIAREATFGPVMAVVEVEDDDEAVALARGAPMGAGASVFTRDRSRALRLAERLEHDHVLLNDIGLIELVRPGLGASHRRVPDFLPALAVSPYPAGPTTYDLIESLIRLRFGRGVRRRIRATVEASLLVRDAWRPATHRGSTP